MGTTLKVGVIGAGIGAGYIAGFQKHPGADVTAVCARTTSRVEPLARRYGIPSVYTDYEAMLEHEPLDIVVVATPNYLHHPMTLTTLKAGKHIVCDKPLALNVVQAREMVEAAEKAQRKHFVPFIWRFLPAARYMREIIEAGFVGQPFHVHVRYLNLGWGDMNGPLRWQYDKQQAGSGSLGNLGSHAIHLIQWWLGNFKRVCALLTTAVKERTLPDSAEHAPVYVDDVCTLLGELEDGTPIMFQASSVALVERACLEIGVFGSEGSLIFSDNWGDDDAPTGRIRAMRRNDHVSSRVPIPQRLVGEFLDMPDYYTPFRTCFTRMAGELVDAIREDRPAMPNFHDGLLVQQVIAAVLKSAEEERWVFV
jgi:predicted dehydrogenase